jgi:hypothetical protein
MDKETREVIGNLTRTMEKGFASVAKDIADLRQTIKGFASVAQDIADLRGDISGLEGEVAEVKGEVAEVKVSIAMLDTRPTAVESKVDGINRRLDTEAIARRDQKLPERVARIEKHLGLNQNIAA